MGERMKEVEINGRKVGDGHPPYIVFELGVCHEQNVELTKHFIQVAAQCGADAVKVEAFQADELVADRTILLKYGTLNDGDITENYYQLLKRLELLNPGREHGRGRGYELPRTYPLPWPISVFGEPM